MHRRATSLLLAALSVTCLALTGCPEKGKEMLQEANDARKEAIDDVGGAPKRQVDHAAERINAAAKANADRYDIPTE